MDAEKSFVLEQIEAVLPLSRAREAFERGLSGHNRGKLVLRVKD